MESKCVFIGVALSQLTATEAQAFWDFFTAQMDRAYTWQLWGAAYVINGGCSDDSFADFRAALISRGHAAFTRVLADADSLAEDDFDAEAWFYEGFAYAVTDGVEAVLGSDVTRRTPPPADPAGYAWSEAEVYALYPRLAEKFA